MTFACVVTILVASQLNPNTGLTEAVKITPRSFNCPAIVFHVRGRLIPRGTPRICPITRRIPASYVRLAG